MADKKAPKAAKEVKTKPEPMTAERAYDLLKGVKLDTPERQGALALMMNRAANYLARKEKYDKAAAAKRAAKEAKKAASVKAPAAKAALRIRKA